MNRAVQIVCLAAIVTALGSAAMALEIETVPVGNVGNTGELSGAGAGGYGPDRICGAVDYAYDIGKYEVTAGQYSEFLNAVAKTDTYGLYDLQMSDGLGACKIERIGSPGSYGYQVAADWEDRPVNYVSWGDAARFANWLTNGMPDGDQDLTVTEDGSYFLNGAVSDADLLAAARKAGARYVIPSEDEWYKAAYHKNDPDPAGDNYFDYPTGSDIVPGNDLVEPDPGNSANFHDGDYTFPAPYYRTEAGEFENSPSPYGTFDQAGNVWEWTEAIDALGRGVDGGGFDNFSTAFHAPRRNFTNPTAEQKGVGFRVAVVPEPATLSLMAGGLPLLLRRRRSRG